MTVRLQISDALRRRIESGELPAQSAIPSERELAHELGVSRMTVRAAIDELVDEGLLIRRHGRKTIVADENHADKINRTAGFSSFSEEMRLRGWQPRSEVRQATTILADVAIAAQLNVPIGARVIVIERLRFADDEPLAHEFVHLAHSRFPDLLALDLANSSLYELAGDQVWRASGVRRGKCRSDADVTARSRLVWIGTRRACPPYAPYHARRR